MVAKSSIRTIISSAFLLTSLAPATSAAPQEPRTMDHSLSSMVHGPSSLLFTQNTGQFDPAVRFQLRGAGGTWWFTDDGIWLTVLKSDHGPRTTDHSRFEDHDPSSMDHDLSSMVHGPSSMVHGPSSLQGVNLHITIPGLSPNAHLVPSDPQSAKMNYFKGNDAAKWRSNVPTYASLIWHDVLPGVDLAFGQSWQVLSNLQSPISNLHLHVDGADAVRVDAAGRLVADTALGSIPLPALLSSQGDPLQATAIGQDVSFTSATPLRILRGPNTVFSTQPTTPLSNTADLLYSTFLGGTGDDLGQDVALDSTGAVYVMGETFSTDFPTTPGAFDVSTNGWIDLAVSKLDPDYSSLIYSTYLGGVDAEYAGGLVVDSAGSAYIAGYTGSGDFPTTPNAYDPVYQGDTDAFVTKLNVSGNALAYSTFLGGGDIDESYALSVSSNGTAYVVGDTFSGNFPTTPGAYSTHLLGWQDAFVTELDASGSALVYSTYLGGSGIIAASEAHGITLDALGQAYVSGWTNSSNFPTTPGAFRQAFNGGYSDGFVTKLNTSGSALVFSTFLGGSGDDCTVNFFSSCKIAIGPDSTVYVAGWTQSSNFPTTSAAYDRTLNGESDVFVTHFNAAGSSLLYSTFLGGSGSDNPRKIAVGSDGSVYVTGDTFSSDFPITPNAFDTTYGGTWLTGADAYASRLNATGSQLLYSTYVGGSQIENGFGVVVDTMGAAYVSGNTTSPDYPVTVTAYDTTYNGGWLDGDAYITRLSMGVPVIDVARVAAAYHPMGGSYRVGARVLVQDEQGGPVPRAQVTLRVALPNGRTHTATRRTNSSGIARLSFATRRSGTYTFTVIEVSKTGDIYNPLVNVETSAVVTIP